MRKVVADYYAKRMWRARGTVVHAAVKAQEGSIKALFRLYFSLNRALIEPE